MALSVYLDNKHRISNRNLFTDIARVLWDDGPPENRRDVYGALADAFRLAPDIAQSDICVLPLVWNYYVDRRRIDLAMQTVEDARKHGKPIVIFSGGDFTANVPFANVTVFERCAYRSRRGWRGNRIFAIPSFIGDYVEMYCGGELRVREKGELPVVGFCGQAAGTTLDFIRRGISNQWRRAAYALHLRRWEPPPFEPTLFRKRVLDQLATSDVVRTNFLLRRRYRAGYWAPKKDPYHPTRLEFVQNILDSDYTVCMRGGGNFSVRFYEVLSLGRIPVFVDTDCVLPYDDILPYRQLCVWVDEDEIPRIARKIAEFHQALSPSEFVDLQRRCRAVWEEYLCRDGFYRHFHEHFPELQRC